MIMVKFRTKDGKVSYVEKPFKTMNAAMDYCNAIAITMGCEAWTEDEDIESKEEVYERA